MTPSLLKVAITGIVSCLFISLTAFVIPFSVGVTTARNASTTGVPVNHTLYDRLLKKYVNEKGLVNYRGFKHDQKELTKYLDMLSNNPPADKWSRNEQVAYWINAYNAYTIQLILNHYPVASIKDIGSKVQIPFVTTPWASKFFKIGGKDMSLDHIERSVLRKQFNEPRIHFALVPAATSGPRLRNEAYQPDKLSTQLDEQGSDFLNNPAKNAISPQRASLSKIFDWYKSDWQKSNKSVDYWVNRYSSAKINRDTPISYLDYNWGLNEQ